MDDITKFEAMQVDCVAKTITYNMQVVAASSTIDESIWTGVADDVNAVQCNNASWRPLIDRGWRIANAYTFTDGAGKEVVAKCG